jgi:Zn-finger nucleic acid-binding protein
MRLEKDQEHWHCEFCGGLYFPEPNADGVRLLGEPAGLDCPVCREPLKHAAVESLRVLYCENCRGLLVDTEAFVVLLNTIRGSGRQGSAPPRPLDREELQREIQCPSCGRQMDTHPYAGPGNIVIDNCVRCHHNWLDHAELKRIAAA